MRNSTSIPSQNAYGCNVLYIVDNHYEMGTKERKVTEFRNIVDGVITRQVESARNVSWPGMDKEARVGQLTLISVDKRDMRPSGIGFSDGHIWAAQSGRMRFEGHTGWLAVASFEDSSDSLVRSWSFESPMQIPISSRRSLTKLTEISDALTWVISPHLAIDELGRLAVLEPGEQITIRDGFAQANESSRQLQESLDRLAEARRMPGTIG